MSGTLILILLALATIIAHKQGIKLEQNDKVIGGVCSGIAWRLGWAPKLVRLLAVIAVLITGGVVIALYLLLWLTLPRR